MLLVVQLTPPGRGAVATLLVEGPGARDIVSAHFRAASGRALASYPPGRPVFGRFGPEPGEEVVVRAASEESVEVHGHGGHAAVARLTEILAEADCRQVDWRDWARDHHKDPITADAHIALAEARTELAAAILLDQYHGALRRAIDAIRALLETDQAAEAQHALETLLARAPLGLHLTTPWQVVLAGPPNVGKSSLINALVGYRRALVHPMPGTTRDVVTAATAVEGWPVELSDTAGLRAGGSAVEEAGIALAKERLAAADLAILVFDASHPWSERDRMLAETRPDALVVHNKWDLADGAGAERPPGLRTSAIRGDGIDELVAAIAHRLVPDPPSADAAVPFTASHVEALRFAAAALVQGGSSAAKLALGRMSRTR
ncbi:MAG: 50S ribosome-binding GTPase [Pirellulales bacterium]|nr:50S ribosome-binding GTPase [Pirellulales bacterium]